MLKMLRTSSEQVAENHAVAELREAGRQFCAALDKAGKLGLYLKPQFTSGMTVCRGDGSTETYDWRDQTVVKRIIEL